LLGNLFMTRIITPLFKVFMPDSVKNAVGSVLFSGYIGEGQKVKELQKLVSEYIGNPRTLLVNSGTSALTLAYRISGVRPGTEVITTPLTCVATNTPILDLGGKPVWVDSDPNTGMVDPNDLQKLITSKTKAITILHKEGDPARLEEIIKIANNNNIKVIEDCAHAFGAKYKGKKIGNHGDFACFSFQAIKHITTGDGGALMCKNNDDYSEAKKYKWFGVDREKTSEVNAWLQDVPDWGYKMNMNDISATIGIECMNHIDQIITSFHDNGEKYKNLLNNIPGLKQVTRSSDDYSTYWAYCILVENRDKLIEKLEREGIASGQIHPRNDVYSMFEESKKHLPGIDYFSKHEMCLPCGWWVTDEEIVRISNIIKSGW
jgi:perosamine synthetase